MTFVRFIIPNLILRPFFIAVFLVGLCVLFSIPTPAFSQSVPKDHSGRLSGSSLKGDYNIKVKRVDRGETHMELSRKQAAQADLDATYGLAIEQFTVLKDFQRGLETLRQSARQGHVDSQVMLGLVLLGWDNIPPDPAAARKWWEKAAAAGHMEALQNVGIMNYYGDGGPQNRAKAFPMLEEAAKAGLPQAQFYTGLSFFHGHGTASNTDKAFEYLQKSALNNYPAAQFVLGKAYLSSGDVKQGYLWIAQAAIQGDKQALQQVMEIEANDLKSPAEIDELRAKALSMQETLKQRRKER